MAAPTLPYQYQWNRNGVAIPNATSQTYITTSADIGDNITCTVTAANGGGSVPATSAAIIVSTVTDKPSNTVLPSITGSPVAGQTLTAVVGNWLQAPQSYSYAWQRLGSGGGTPTPIQSIQANAVAGTTFTITLAPVVTHHLITLMGVEYDQIPIASVRDNVGGVWEPGPIKSGVTNTDPGRLQPWFCRDAPGGVTIITITLTQGATATYGLYMATEWNLIGATAAPGAATTNGTSSTATSPQFTPTQNNDLIIAMVSAQSVIGSPSTGWTALTPTNNNNVFDQSYNVSGAAYLNDPSTTAETAQWPLGANTTFSTLIMAFTTSGTTTVGTLSTYVPVTGDVGHPIQLSIIAHNQLGDSLPASSVPTASVASAGTIAPTLITPPVVTDTTSSGTFVAGDIVSATNGTWNNGPTSFAYQWARIASGVSTNIPGATTSTYTLANADVGDTITCTVLAINGAALSGVPATSAATPTIAAGGAILEGN